MTISEVMLEWNFRIGLVFSNSLFYGLRIWGKYVTLSYLGKKWLAFGKMRNSTFHLLNPCFCHTNSHLQSPSCPYVFPSSISYTMENFVKVVFLEKVIPLCVPRPTAKAVYSTPCGFSLLLDNLDIELPFIT